MRKSYRAQSVWLLETLDTLRSLCRSTDSKQPTFYELYQHTTDLFCDESQQVVDTTVLRHRVEIGHLRF